MNDKPKVIIYGGGNSESDKEENEILTYLLGGESIIQYMDDNTIYIDDPRNKEYE